jgi:hypothetical protein
MKARKAIYTLSLLVAAFALLVITAPVRAAETDDRIESAAKDSYATAGQPEKSAIFNNAAQIWNHTLSAKNGKAVGKATLKTKKRAV